MKHSKLWLVVIPIILVLCLIAAPAYVTLSKMGYFTPAPTAAVTATAPGDAEELVFVADYDYDPYSFLNEDGTPNGMDAELAYELANRLGMRPRIEFGTWSECKTKIKEGDADILLGLEIFVDGTSTGTLKSIPVGADTLSIIGKDKIDDAAALSQKRVGVSFGSALMGLFRLNCEYAEFFTYSEMLEALDKGEIDYAICHGSVAARIIEKNGYDLVPSLVLMESFPTMGIRQDEPQLLTEVNAALENMSEDGTIAALRDKWIISNVENRTASDVFAHNTSFYVLFAIFAVVFLAGYFVAVILARAYLNRRSDLRVLEEHRQKLEEALHRETERTREEKAFQLALLNNAYSYSRINLSKNAIVPPIVERENGQPVDYTGKFPNPLPSYEEVFAIGASRYVEDGYKESYVAYHNCAYLLRCFEEGNLMPEYICHIYSTKIGWHFRKYITYLSKDEVSGDIYGMSVAYDVTKEYEAAEKEKQYLAELEEARNVAESANKSKTNFLFNMSHDIRTPMNAILGYTDIGVRHIDDNETVRDSLNKIKIAGSHLLNLINDILEMSRIESGALELVESPVNIHEAIYTIEQMSKSLAFDKDIDFSVDIGEIGNPYIYADELHVDEVIINLISNAVKYTDRGGKVVYSVSQISGVEDGKVRFRFEVSDNGIGMSKDFQKHLFETFSREKNSTVSKVEGTGIGLSIVKRIIDMAGGTISVVSEPGKGSTFTVELPFRVMDEAAAEEFRKQNDNEAIIRDDAVLEGKKILLVEDNEMNREIATELLEESGLVIESAEDGKIAVDMVKEKGIGYYDFILMDIQMPVMDGYEATKAIRALPDGDRIPIIALSANAFKEDIDKSLAVGMNDHVAKPIDVKKLFEVMHRLIK